MWFGCGTGKRYKKSKNSVNYFLAPFFIINAATFKKAVHLTTNTAPLAGMYPLITRLDPLQSRKGLDNLGWGETQHGEKFMIKLGGRLGTAEFVGAKVCDACGIPACQPTIVTIEKMGQRQNVFGSRMESGEHVFDQSSVNEWQRVLGSTINASSFSALLAVDLALGNDDRHWNNWFVHDQSTASKSSYRLRAMDFSRSWPTTHPAQHPSKHNSLNTWNATKDWPLLGVNFDLQIFHQTCARISTLRGGWLYASVLSPLIGVFISPAEASEFATWWENSLQEQIVNVIFALEYGARP